MKKIFFYLSLAVFSLSVAAQPSFMLVAGTYTRGKSVGIYTYDFNSADGRTTILDSVKTSNPSYVVASSNGKFLYAVNEDDEKKGGGKITAFSIDKQTGHATQLNQQSSKGTNPCYIALDKTGHWLAVGNYSSGTLALLPVLPNGNIGAAVTTIQQQGNGSNQMRQEGPHVHATIFSADNKFLFVTNLGTDKVYSYSFNAKSGNLLPLTDHSFIKLLDGSGPRHLDFHRNGKWAYLVQELSGTVTVLRYHNGKFSQLQTISMLPKDYTGTPASADIHVSPDGRFLYASNRNTSNTIAIFSVDAKTGKLALVGHQSTLGEAPRNFTIDPTGNFMLVANQDTDNVAVFRIDHKTGLLTNTGNQINVPNPVCLKWVKK